MEEQINYDIFLDKYEPIQNHIAENRAYDGCMFETYGEECEFVINYDSKHVWTIIEGESDALYACSGFHLVNRIGFFITKKPYKGKYAEVAICDHWDIIADYTKSYLENNSDDKAWLLSTCEEQGIIAAGVCFKLMKEGREREAKAFINGMSQQLSSDK